MSHCNRNSVTRLSIRGTAFAVIAVSSSRFDLAAGHSGLRRNGRKLTFADVLLLVGKVAKLWQPMHMLNSPVPGVVRDPIDDIAHQAKFCARPAAVGRGSAFSCACMSYWHLETCRPTPSMSVYRAIREVIGRRSERRNCPLRTSLSILIGHVTMVARKNSSHTPQSASIGGSMRQKLVGGDQSHHACENQ
jgi:hypothetical protein